MAKARQNHGTMQSAFGYGSHQKTTFSRISISDTQGIEMCDLDS